MHEEPWRCLLALSALLDSSTFSWIQALLFDVDIQNMAILSLSFRELAIKQGCLTMGKDVRSYNTGRRCTKCKMIS